MVRTFLEYRRVKRGTHVARETTDYVAAEETTENRIVPDAAFVMENITTNKRALFFVEMDMATERIISRITREDRITLHYKIRQYDRYLKSLRYAKTYAPYGEFGFFTLLFVTLGDERVENIRREMHDYRPIWRNITASPPSSLPPAISSGLCGSRDPSGTISDIH